MEKFILRSRRVWAAIISFLPAVITTLGEFGVPVPAPDVLVQGLDGVVQSILGAIAGVLALLSAFKPDGATVVVSSSSPPNS